MLLALSFIPGFGERANSAITFNVMAILFSFLFFFFPYKWRWKYWLLVPVLFSLTAGLVSVIVAITNDNNAWAVGWMLLVCGVAAGTALAARYGGYHRLVYQIGLGTAVGMGILFAFFGMIFGGAFMRITALLLLAVAGGLLFWMGRRGWRLEDWLKAPLAQPSPSPKVSSARQPVLPLVEPLSKRELEVLQLIDAGLSNQAIAERMTVAPSTVKTHINNIYSKLSVESRVQAIHRAKDLGLLP